MLSTDLGSIAFSPGAEEWIEYGQPDHRRRVGFHDYAALYDVPGLYERVFRDELGMRSADVVVGLYAEALAALGREPGAERVLDFGAGNGIGGELLREVGVGFLIGLDREPAARRATERDRPGCYDAFVVADVAVEPEALEVVAAHAPTAVLAISAIGTGHIPLDVLAGVLERLVEPGGLFGFAVADELVPGFFEELFARVGAQRLAERSYVHRRQVDGTPHRATAVLARRV